MWLWSERGDYTEPMSWCPHRCTHFWATNGSESARYGTRADLEQLGNDRSVRRQDPINIASRHAHAAGMTVLFAAGNAGPENDTLIRIPLRRG